jgi:hypothetical protein
MILLLLLSALYTLHCYAAYSLLLLPSSYDPPPTALCFYTLHYYAAYSLLPPPYDPPPTAFCSLYTALLRCLQAAATSL